MHDGACALIAGVRSHANPSSVGAVGCLHAIDKADACTEVLDFGEVVPIGIYGLYHGIRDALLLLGSASVTDGVADGAFRNGDDFQHVAIAHIAVGSLGISTSVVDGCWFQVLHPVDAPVVLQILRRLVVIDGWFRVFAPAEALFLDSSTTGYHLATSESHGCSTGKTGVGGHGGCLSQCR